VTTTEPHVVYESNAVVDVPVHDNLGRQHRVSTHAYNIPHTPVSVFPRPWVHSSNNTSNPTEMGFDLRAWLIVHSTDLAVPLVVDTRDAAIRAGTAWWDAVGTGGFDAAAGETWARRYCETHPDCRVVESQ
jgi:hypothetical protein